MKNFNRVSNDIVQTGNKTKDMKAVGILSLILIIIFIIPIIISIVNKPKIDYNYLQLVDIDAPYVEYQANASRGLEMYNNKNFKLTGTISKIYPKYIQVSSDSNLYSVELYYKSEYSDQVKTLNIGDKITFAGKLRRGVFGAWQVQDGVILE